MHYHNTLSRVTTVLAVALVGACAATSRTALVEPVTPQWPEPVGTVEIIAAASSAPARRLDVAVVVFDPGIPEDPVTHSREGIFPEIRNAEARYVAAMLREVMVAANAWGVVRVMPEPDASAELQVQGTILESNGSRLALQIAASDATGRVWLDRIYVDVAAESDYPVAPGSDPYLDLYHQIANDLLAVRNELPAADVQRVAQTGLLRYAATLSPEAFGSFLQRDADGRFRLLRLPSTDDPMLARVQRVRNQEFLFIDTVDEQFLDMLQEMRPTYDLWRQYGREQAIYKQDYQQRLGQRETAGRRGSFAAMQQTYNAFKWSKIQQQDLRELAKGFNNEVSPTVLQVAGKVFRLNGSLEGQYAEWRRILREIFALETGLPAQRAE